MSTVGGNNRTDSDNKLQSLSYSLNEGEIQFVINMYLKVESFQTLSYIYYPNYKQKARCALFSSSYLNV